MAVISCTQHWTWKLIDTDGDSVAAGVAATQEGAMEVAWKAAKALCASAADQMPSLVVQRTGDVAPEEGLPRAGG
jgi:hypothetical protein